MQIDFKDKVVLITGATRGIGKQIADDFAALGANLILTGTKKEQIDQLNRKAQDSGTKKKYYCVDFSDRGALDQFIQDLEKFDRIDICVNNAGINRINDIDETKVKDLDEMMDINLRAPFLLMKTISRIMKKNKYGRIINISSIYGVVSREKRSVYSTTKFGLLGMTTAAAVELAQYNILVNAVSPGVISTDLTDRILSEKDKNELIRRIPIKRFGTPKEISNFVLFLASDLNTYLTGQNVIIDGGYVSV